MTQSELEQLLAGAIQPIAEALAELDGRIDTVGSAAVEAARATMRELLAGALLDFQRVHNDIREDARQIDRSGEAVRAQVADSILALERRLASLRDGSDGVGIRSVSLAADKMTMTFEFTDDSRFDCPLPRGEQGDRGASGIGIDAPAWQAGVHRQHTLVQHYEGRIYCALVDTADEPGDSTAWKRLGRLGQRWCGPFQEGHSYEVGDLYVKGGTFQVLASGEHRCLAPKPLAPSEVRTIARAHWEEREAVLRADVAAMKAELKRTTDELALACGALSDQSTEVRSQSAVIATLQRDLDAVVRLTNQLRAALEEQLSK